MNWSSSLPTPQPPVPLIKSRGHPRTLLATALLSVVSGHTAPQGSPARPAPLGIHPSRWSSCVHAAGELQTKKSKADTGGERPGFQDNEEDGLPPAERQAASP